MDDFIKGQGHAFLAHLLRRLADDFVRDVALWYPTIGIKAPPRTHSTMLLLSLHGELGVTEIAGFLRQSHPLVLTWIRQLKDLGFVHTRHDPNDGRRSIVFLTPLGREDLLLHKKADAIAARAYDELMHEVDAPVFEALWRMEAACRRRPFLDRLQDVSLSVAPAVRGKPRQPHGSRCA